MSADLEPKLDESCGDIREIIGDFLPEIAVVLGSGLGSVADCIEDAVCIPFKDVVYMRSSTATSHIGRFVFGTLAGKRVVCMQGRLHGYEGYGSFDVAYPIWIMWKLGASTLITTNAVGAINPDFNVGDFCMMTDQINFTGRNPVAGLGQDELSDRFFSMYECFSPILRKAALDVACKKDVTLREGVYLGLLGPSFETTAEIKAFGVWGADTVAMSVCEEVIAARYVGMRVLGLSLVSNMACGVHGANPMDDDVLAVAAEKEKDMCELICGVIEQI